MFSALLSLLACFTSPNTHAAQAHSLPPDVLKARVAQPHYARESLQLALPDGRKLTAEIRVPGPRPLTDSENKLPAVLIFGGFVEAATVLDKFDPKFPLVLASFDYPYTPPRRF